MSTSGGIHVLLLHSESIDWRIRFPCYDNEILSWASPASQSLSEEDMESLVPSGYEIPPEAGG